MSKQNSHMVIREVDGLKGASYPKPSLHRGDKGGSERLGFTPSTSQSGLEAPSPRAVLCTLGLTQVCSRIMLGCCRNARAEPESFLLRPMSRQVEKQLFCRSHGQPPDVLQIAWCTEGGLGVCSHHPFGYFRLS